MNVVPTYLEPADAARQLAVVPATVKDYGRRGLLPIAARTMRGGHLFLAEDVEALRRRREAQAESRG